MTSTSFNVGLTDNTRSSSRVLRPPGGGHTDIFGGEPEPPRGRRAGPPQQPTHVIGQGDEPKTNGTSVASNGAQDPQLIAETPAPTPDSPKESPITPVTPEPVKTEVRAEPVKTEVVKAEPVKTEAVKAEPVKAEPPKRVRVPPGGFSSGLWDDGN